jgi:hypothetical protein
MGKGYKMQTSFSTMPQELCISIERDRRDEIVRSGRGQVSVSEINFPLAALEAGPRVGPSRRCQGLRGWHVRVKSRGLLLLVQIVHCFITRTTHRGNDMFSPIMLALGRRRKSRRTSSFDFFRDLAPPRSYVEPDKEILFCLDPPSSIAGKRNIRFFAKVILIHEYALHCQASKG